MIEGIFQKETIFYYSILSLGFNENENLASSTNRELLIELLIYIRESYI